MGTQTQHREQVRQKIIQSALQLFNRHGFTAASIDDIMAGAGMTRGGFYSYFQSKSELYAEAISCFVTEKQEVIAGSDKRDPMTAEADAHAMDYTKFVSPDGLRGKIVTATGQFGNGLGHVVEEIEPPAHVRKRFTVGY